MAASPEEIVQRQLNAYNLGDIDAFMETYHRDIHIYNFPDQPLFQDWEIVRQRYAELFANNPDLHCKIVNRIVEGNRVIDQEKVTGLKGGGIIRATAIYTIYEEKITEVRFLRP